MNVEANDSGRLLFASQPVIVVSGLPRSGTSMMMKMLEAGGLPIFSDGERRADRDNPNGYYEFERVKKLDKGDTAWVGDARGKVIKVISQLLQYLPGEYEYYILFMRRVIPEVLASQRVMLATRGMDPGGDDATMAEVLERHVAHTLAWVTQQPNMSLLEVDYNLLLSNSLVEMVQIVQFVPYALDTRGMISVVDPSLYRNRT